HGPAVSGASTAIRPASPEPPSRGEPASPWRIGAQRAIQARGWSRGSNRTRSLLPGGTGDPDRWTIQGESETSPSHENVPRSPACGPSAPPTRIALGGCGESGGWGAARVAAGWRAGEPVAAGDAGAVGPPAAPGLLASGAVGAGEPAGPAQPAMTNTR